MDDWFEGSSQYYLCFSFTKDKMTVHAFIKTVVHIALVKIIFSSLKVNDEDNMKN